MTIIFQDLLSGKLTLALSREVNYRQPPENLYFFSYIIKCQSINYDSVKFQVNRLLNKKVTIHLSASSNKQEGATLLILFYLDGSDEIGYFTWKFQLHALMM